jgi:Ran GTPase-activating protein (RanGAP) involved in mRNA processing and transport
VIRDGDGNETTNWFLLRCPQFKHINLCLNSIDDEIALKIEDVLMRTPDDFGFTLSGCPMSNPVVSKIHRAVANLHRQRCQDARLADASNSSIMELEDIGSRRCAF